MEQAPIRFRIRRMLAGLTTSDVEKLVELSLDRAGELLMHGETSSDIAAVRCKLGEALDRGPALRTVFLELSEGKLVPGRAGRNVRWTRIIFDSTLREWSAAFTHSIPFWSQFERSEERATGCLERGALADETRERLGLWMVLAAYRLGTIFPEAMFPDGGSDE